MKMNRFFRVAACVAAGVLGVACTQDSTTGEDPDAGQAAGSSSGTNGSSAQEESSSTEEGSSSMGGSSSRGSVGGSSSAARSSSTASSTTGSSSRPASSSASGATSGGFVPGQSPYSEAATFETTVDEVPMDIYHPVPASPDRVGLSGFPMVVLLQGGNVSKGNYAAYARGIAQQGFVVAVPERERSLIVTGLFPDYVSISSAMEALTAENTRAGSPLQGKVDTTRSALLGHSLGAAVGLEAVGNECSFQFCTSGTYTRPASLKAAVFYGGNRAGFLGGPPSATANGPVAILMMQGGEDGVASPEVGEATWEAVANSPKAFLTLTGGNHYSVTDTQSPAGATADSSPATVSQSEGLEVLIRWTAAFLRTHVTQDSAARRYVQETGDGQDPKVTLRQAIPSTGIDGPGACSFDRSTTTLAAGDRNIPLTLFVPQGTGGPWPAVIFNAGTSLSPDEYTTTLEHLASWCFVVVANNSTYSVLLGSPDESWTADITSIAEALKTGGVAAVSSAVNRDKLALMGHSAGAKNGMRALRANPALVNTVVTLDIAGQNPVLDLESITSPVLMLGERFSGLNAFLGQYCAPLEQNFEAYYEALPSGLPTQAVTFLNAMHMSWLDAQDCSTCGLCTDNPDAEHADVRRLTRKYATAWLRRFLLADTAMDTHLNGESIQQDVSAQDITYVRK